MKSWAWVIAVVMMAGTWGMIESRSYSEPAINKKPFEEFPLVLADRWRGKDMELPKEVLEILQLSDYMMRVYKPIPTPESVIMKNGAAEGKTRKSNSPFESSPIWLYVGYYQSQRTGVTYHSPKNCLPGAGWQFVDSEYISVPIPDTPAVTINRVLVEKGLDQLLILYWYQDRGRVIASEYWAKAYLIWDAITMNRTDGSLVRISIPVINSPDEASQRGLRFLKDLWPFLLDYMPDQAINPV